MQLLQNSGLITGFAILQYPLYDSATIGMRGENVHLAPESFDDELDVLRWYSFDGFLHDVISVLIFDTLEDIGLEFCDEFGLLVGEDIFQSLYRSALIITTM